MSTLTRLDYLKAHAAGFREKLRFEWTTDNPGEELMGVARPDKWVTRIFSELDFAVKLSENEGGAFDDIIDKALAPLENALSNEGALTRGACQAAEDRLMPLSERAREYEVILCAHAHIDMNWMWSMPETVAITLATFRTVLNLMDQYPKFTFSQSQASVYKIIEQYDPALMKRIRARIEEGRWEVTATAWVETDKNMPDAESLLRHVTETRAYLKDTWGVDPASLEIDFSPDTFGHSRHIPEINTFAEVKYYYHCRGRLNDTDTLHLWRAPSGSEIMVYCEPYWYNSGITPDAALGAIEAAKRSGGLKTSLIVYGTGDHGGGPTRRDVERALDMMNWRVFPRLRFGTLREYFHIAEAARGNLRVITEEKNFLFDGCYTTQSRIKRGNRYGERALLTAEAIDALAPGDAYPQDRLRAAWRDLLFTQFHDILPGSCVRDTREHAMGLFANVMATAESARNIAMERVNAQIDTSMFKLDADISDTRSEGAGAGYGYLVGAGIPSPERGAGKTRIYTVYNPSPFERADNVLITVWDWLYDRARIRWTDAGGDALEYQLIDAELKHYWQHHYFRVLVRVRVPALGYATIALTERARDKSFTRMNDYTRADTPLNDAIILENECLRAEFEPFGGTLTSLIDKQTGKETLKPGARGGLAFIECERDTNDAWHIGRHISSALITDARKISKYEGGLRKGFECEYAARDSVIRLNVALNKGDAYLTYTLNADWREYAKQNANTPVLAFAAPLAEAPEYFRMDVPAGIADRAARNMDMPALSYAAAVYGARAVMLASDSKYGYRLAGGALSITLINSARHPDPYPEFGEHDIQLMLGVSDTGALSLKNTAHAFLHPFAACPNGSHIGALAPSGSFMQIEGECVLSAIGRAPSGIWARVYEPSGKQARVRVKPAFEVKRARLVNAMGAPTGEKVDIEGGAAAFTLNKHAIAQLEINY